MKEATRKIIGSFFLFLWFTPLLLVLFFSVWHRAIRYSMEQKMERQQLQKISIPQNAVIWMDDEEILVDGLAFDIHSAAIENGMYVFEGLFDEDETRLVKQQNRKTEKNGDEQSLLTQLFKCLESTYGNREHAAVFSIYHPGTCHFFKPSFLLRLLRKVPTPPPWNSRSIS